METVFERFVTDLEMPGQRKRSENVLGCIESSPCHKSLLSYSQPTTLKNFIWARDF